MLGGRNKKNVPGRPSELWISISITVFLPSRSLYQLEGVHKIAKSDTTPKVSIRLRSVVPPNPSNSSHEARIRPVCSSGLQHPGNATLPD